jgi:hypothetical protein
MARGDPPARISGAEGEAKGLTCVKVHPHRGASARALMLALARWLRLGFGSGCGGCRPMRHLIKENTALRRMYYRIQILRAKSQSDEGRIIGELSKDAERTFVEFGFHPIEFNCIDLARDPEWCGLLIDSSARYISDARTLYSDRIKFVEAFLSLDNLDFIKTAFRKIGVLSVDVDGNDYWFLESLIDVKPDVICVEYNSTLGLDAITVPYDPSFDRNEKHPTGWYHGASLTALAKLCARSGYGLAAVSSGGMNAFFTRTGLLVPEQAWRANSLREQFSGVAHSEQWTAIKDMPFVSVA